MALITCPECGKEVSDQAEKCPHCGYPLLKNRQKRESGKNRKAILWIAIGAAAAAAALIVVLAVVPMLQKAGRARPFRTVGNTVAFGTYPQTAEGTDETPIEWLVMDVQGDKALLLSRYGLDAKPYNMEQKDITWETCTLRTWLNGEFLTSAFSAEEQKAILTTDVDNGKEQGYSGWSTSGGNDTQDKVFLLSYAEAHRYLGVEYWKVSGSDKNTKSRVAPTAYAENGAWTSDSGKTADGAAAGWWWLRSPGYDQSDAACVDIDGSLNYEYVTCDGGCVRPALWINLESDIF